MTLISQSGGADGDDTHSQAVVLLLSPSEERISVHREMI